jgi:Spy/CpxP family protein refolding chaperone
MNKDILQKRREPREASRLHKVTVSIIVLLVAALATWAVVSIADDEPVSGGRGHWEHGMKGGGPLQAMTRHLDLTEEQQEQAKAIAAATMKEGKALREKMEGMREQIVAGIRENGYQEDEVRLIAENNMPLLVDMAVLRIRAMAEIYEILTPEQKAEADALMAQVGTGGGPGRHGRHFGRHSF